MHKITPPALLALALGGCAMSPQYGNFVESTAPDQHQLAADAVQQLVTLYVPAQTRLQLQQPTPDPFGQALVQSLRDKGYALVEFAPGAPSAPGGLPLRYVLDQADDDAAPLFRLTLMIGNQAIARPYLAQNGVFAPAGYWVRRE